MMKKHVISVLLVTVLAGTAAAQNLRMLELRGGHFNPKDAKSGMILGGTYGISFDERVSLGFGLDIFHKGYKKESTVATEVSESGVVENTVTRTLEYSTTLVPLSLNLDIRLPFEPPFCFYIGGSLAFEMLFNSENNYEEDIKEKRFYSGFGWMARAGVEYAIGRRSALILEAFYNNCRVSSDAKKKEGLPVWKEVDMSGLGFRAGVRLDFY
ncbi:porin family protein [bacterium]|nr:porin family protein [bacterium]